VLSRIVTDVALGSCASNALRSAGLGLPAGNLLLRLLAVGSWGRCEDHMSCSLTSPLSLQAFQSLLDASFGRLDGQTMQTCLDEVGERVRGSSLVHSPESED
jgi:hypothetical protein